MLLALTISFGLFHSFLCSSLSFFGILLRFELGRNAIFLSFLLFLLSPLSLFEFALFSGSAVLFFLLLSDFSLPLLLYDAGSFSLLGDAFVFGLRFCSSLFIGCLLLGSFDSISLSLFLSCDTVGLRFLGRNSISFGLCSGSLCIGETLVLGFFRLLGCQSISLRLGIRIGLSLALESLSLGSGRSFLLLTLALGINLLLLDPGRDYGFLGASMFTSALLTICCLLLMRNRGAQSLVRFSNNALRIRFNHHLGSPLRLLGLDFGRLVGRRALTLRLGRGKSC